MKNFRELKSGKVASVFVIRIVHDFLESLLSQEIEVMLNFVLEMSATSWHFDCDSIYWIRFVERFLVNSRCSCR